MDKVQFQLEATLPELQDLHEKGLFTKLEINQITRRRTALETSLIRQKTRKEDYFSYAEYEINLERLRKVRWKRLGYDENPPPPSPSTYSIPRRVLYILKRATVKFPSDIAVWLAYVEFAAREGMRKVVLKGLTNALQHHSHSPTLYLLLSFHHLHPSDPFPREAIPSSSTLPLPPPPPASSFSLEGTSSARTTLLLGLRACQQSTELWTEYIKLELGWVEALRRRWSALGLETDGKSKAKEAEIPLDGGEGSFGPEGEDARKAILAGQLVIQALRSALEAVNSDHKGLAYREELVKMLRVYPSPLRHTALELLYEDLAEISERKDEFGARTRMMILTRKLYERSYAPGQADGDGFALEGVELIDELGRIGKEIRKEAKTRGSEWANVAGEWLAELCSDDSVDSDMQRYLFSILSTLASSKLKPSVKLLLRYIDSAPSFLSSDELQAAIKSHSGQYPTDARLQRRYLGSLAASGHAQLLTACEEAAKAVTGPRASGQREEDTQVIWILWADTLATLSKSKGEWQKILKLSQKLEPMHIFPAILAKYCSSALGETSDPIKLLNDIASRYGPPASFYAGAFRTLSQGSQSDLAKVYEMWSRACKNPRASIEAAITWAGWLLQHRKAHEARRVVEVVKVGLDGAFRVELEGQWQALLDQQSSLHGEDDVMEE